jgi:hypothetical protein
MNTMNVPERFWEEFLAEPKSKGPVLLKKPFARPLATAEELFDVLCEMADDVRTGNLVPMHLQISVGHGIHFADRAPMLPRREDRSIRGWGERITRELGRTPFEFHVRDGMQGYDGGLWVRGREVMQGLVRAMGIPPGGAKIETFSGRYDHTSSGIHLDTSDVLSFVVDGPKKMYFWPEGTFKRREDPERAYPLYWTSGTGAYEKYLDSAICLEGEPGDVFYWPRSYWHIAASDMSTWTTTLNISVEWFAPPGAALMYALDAAGMMYSGAEPAPYDVGASIKDPAVPPPGSLLRELESFRASVASPMVEEVIKEVWLRIVTGCGFLRPPRPVDAPSLRDDDVLVADARYPILTVPSGDQLLVSACGHVRRVRPTAGVTRLVERINQGGRHRVGDLVALADAPEAGDLLRSLVTFRGLSLA